MKFLNNNSFLLFLSISFAAFGRNEVEGVDNSYVTKIKDWTKEHEKQFLEFNSMLIKLKIDFNESWLTKTASEITVDLNVANDHYSNLIINMEAACTFNRETIGNYQRHFLQSRKKDNELSKVLTRQLNYLNKTIEYTSKKTTEANTELKKFRKTLIGVYGKLYSVQKTFNVFADITKNQIKSSMDKITHKLSSLWKFPSTKRQAESEKNELEKRAIILDQFLNNTRTYRQSTRELKEDLNELFDGLNRDIETMKIILEHAHSFLNSNTNFSVENFKKELDKNFEKIVSLMSITSEMSCFFITKHSGKYFDEL